MCQLGHSGFWNYERVLIDVRHQGWRREAANARLAQSVPVVNEEPTENHKILQSGTVLGGALAFIYRTIGGA